MALQTYSTNFQIRTRPRLRWRVLPIAVAMMLAPVAGSTPSAAVAGIPQQVATFTGAPITTFDGSWEWADARAQSITRLDIRGTTVHAYLRCSADPCDLGTVEGTVYWNPAEAPAVAVNLRARAIAPRLTVVGPNRNAAATGRNQAAVRSDSATSDAGSGQATPTTLVATFSTAFRTLMVIVSPPRGTGVSRTAEVELYSDIHDIPRPSRETVTFSRRRVMMAGPGPGRDFPQLPMPLPTPSISTTLEQGLVTEGRGETLGAAFDRLKKALRHAEIPQWKVYGIGDGGFAIVSQAERIEDNGRAFVGLARWPPPLADIDPAAAARSFSAYLRQLFLGAGPGRYRVIVFAVTDELVDTSGGRPTPAQIDALMGGGETFLPEELRSAVLGANGRCEVLIYEFTRAASEDAARQVPRSGILMDNHLTGAGLWTAAQLGPGR